MVDLVVVMPAYNEAGGIAEFLEEISAALRPVDHQLIVQDDGSTDATITRVQDVAATGVPVEVTASARNLGHGASTLAVLARAVSTGAGHVVAVDGDGQFRGHDVARLVRQCREEDLDVVEGVRSGRREAVYRKFVTLGTQMLVWWRCRRLPRDANTPLRVYRTSTLVWLLEQVPPSSPTPNLHISALTRSSGLRYAEVPVEWLVRRGDVAHGSSGFGRRLLPSIRFVRFAAEALRQWVRPVDVSPHPEALRELV